VVHCLEIALAGLIALAREAKIGSGQPMTPNTPPEFRPVAGMMWMFASSLSFVMVTALVKFVGSDLPAMQTAFIRFAAGLVLMAPLFLKLRMIEMTPRLWQLSILRAAIHVGAVGLWFYSITRIPLTDVTALNYLNPIAVTVGAALFLGERLALRRGLAILVALLGALVILRPGFREISIGHLTMLGAAVSFGCSYVVAKRLSEKLPATLVVTLMTVMVTVGLAPFAYAVWVPVNLTQLFWLSAVAVFATLGHYTMTHAFAVAPVAVTQPVTFLQLIWATLMGVLVFGEALDPVTLLGGGVIISAVSFITWREAMLKRAQARA
jgi:drug/metabolite transporter (DMT)-like permease